jgi:hypothetical protein
MIVETIKDKYSWQNYLQQLPGFPGKIYYSFDYYRLLSANEEGTPVLLVYKDHNKVFALYPFLLKKIPNAGKNAVFFDIESGYGYGGPFFIEQDSKHIKAFKQLHSKWCHQNHIVAEFVRLNPFICNHEPLLNYYCCEKNRTTVAIDTTSEPNEIIKQASEAKRRNFFKAKKAGLILKKCELSPFKNLYFETMQNLNADSYYFFSEQYFSKLFAFSNKNIQTIGVYTVNDELAACAVFLIDSISWHYHLGASDSNFLNLRPNEFLFFNSAFIAGKAGAKFLHLGGGRNNTSDDSLFRFKKGFSFLHYDFFIGKKIHCGKKYKELSTAWQKRTGKKPYIHLHYHYGEKQ